MAGVVQKNALGSIWPLGLFTITGGTPINILSKVAPQTAGSIPTGRPYAPGCTQIVFSALTANTGDIFINDGNYAGATDPATVAVVAKGVTTSLPFSTTTSQSKLDPARYWVDGTTGDKVAIYCVDSSA